MTFASRYKLLNAAQKRAVDTIEGPVLVVAGPGTGKTELLSMRVAHILKTTDTLPENILCLTFTDSGAVAMRERLTSIIGPAAYKVAIHTFHSFGTEIIGQNREYFFRGAQYQPADDIAVYDILTTIFEELRFDNPLASRNNDEFVYLRDVRTAISELKKSGLTSDELLAVLDDNEATLDMAEPQLASVFSGRISKSTASLVMPIAEQAAALPVHTLPSGLAPLSSTLALSLARAFDAAATDNSTKPITAWRNAWMEQNAEREWVFKDRKRHAKLRALAHIYYRYLSELEAAELFDYDDMILQVVHALETQPDLRANLQEKYQYILVDEYQDTNLAQLRILFALTDNPVNEGRPNIMAVGDDDQAIYSFQGADRSNINRFIEQFRDTTLIALTDNYRSSEAVITHAREVITQGDQRLESAIEWLDKTLTVHTDHAANVTLSGYTTPDHERAATAQAIATLRKKHPSTSIAVIARTHHELEALVPYFAAEHVPVAYDRRDNVLDSPPVRAAELIAAIAVAIYESRFDAANALLPELLSHPAFGYDASSVWRLSLAAYSSRRSWLEQLSLESEYTALHLWLITLARDIPQVNAEELLDRIVGKNDESTDTFVSPLATYYFGTDTLEHDPAAYLSYLDALRTIRAKVREYQPGRPLTLLDFLEVISLYRDMNLPITSTHRIGGSDEHTVALLTAHKSKGLEFDHVYVLGVSDSIWGQKARSRSRIISYPENLPLAPAGDSYDERLRLFFVAMTRAKQALHLSFAAQNSKGRQELAASFLAGTSLTAQVVPAPDTPTELAQLIMPDWRASLLDGPSETLHDLLEPTLADYRLSVTHLNNFLDVTRGGPQFFLTNNLLHFPSAKSSTAAYGTAIHATLQRAHDHVVAYGHRRPTEDIIHDFETFLAIERLSADDYQHFTERGAHALQAFMAARGDSFTTTQRTELDFRSQSVVVDEALLAGKLDLVDIDVAAKRISVSDYKTGKPSLSITGRDDYEKIKLHKYKQQLMFYRLLIEHSRDYSRYVVDDLRLQFVEPTPAGEIVELSFTISDEDMAQFRSLVGAVWRHIRSLDLPDVSGYEQTLAGIQAFEQALLDE